MNQTLRLPRRKLVFAALASLTLSSLPVLAQDEWPNKPVRIIVPSSPGGGTDIYARILAQALSEQLKQSVFVENRPGASGNIGADAVARADADGYTILVASNSSLGINPVLLKKMPFEIERDLAPVARGVMAPMVVVVPPQAGFKTMKALIEHARREPEGLTYGSAGVGSAPYLGVRMIEEVSGAKFTHVPYKGVAPAYQDLLAGRLQFMFTDIASADTHIASGRLVALAVNQPSSSLPHVPTLAEVGYPQVRAWISFSVMAPAKVPLPIIKRLGAEIAIAMRKRDVAQRLEKQALVPVFDTPEEFAMDLRKEREHWGQFIRRRNITPE